jgi:tetratricopeptide (TPR) repeat protein
MTRFRLVRGAVICGGVAAALTWGAAAQPIMPKAAGGDPAADSAWAQCLARPTRACVLGYAAEVSQSIGDVIELGRIAEAQATSGLMPDAVATIEQALRTSQSIADDRDRDEALVAVVRAQAKAGKFPEAVDLAGSIKNLYQRASAITSIAVAEGKAGRIDEALQLVQFIENKSDRARAIREVAWDLRSVAVMREEDGKIVGALRDAVSIEEEVPRLTFFTGVHHPSEFGPALLIIAEAEAQAGKISEALQVAGSIRDKRDRAITLAAIAGELVHVGRVAEALQIAWVVEDTSERGVVLDRLLEPQSAFHLLTEERATTDEPLAKPDGRGEDLRVAMAFPDAEQQSLALGIVAMARAKAGDTDGAAEVNQLIDWPRPRFLALSAIAEAQAKAGLRAQSIASFGLALQAARSLERRDIRLSDLATAQARAGQFAEALHVTQLIEDRSPQEAYMVRGELISASFARRSALYAIAEAQAKAGKADEALQTARSFELPPEAHYQLGSGLGVVAEGLAEAGRIDEAVQAAQAVENPHWRSDLLAAIARKQAAAGKIAEAIEVANAVTENADRVSTLVAIAAAQLKAGLPTDAFATFAQALQIAQSLPHKAQVAPALLSIGRELPG